MVALCNVPPSESPHFAAWLGRVSPLLSCPSELLTLVQGSELDPEDLKFAGAVTARSVLILAPPIEDGLPNQTGGGGGGVATDAADLKAAKQTADCQTVLTALRVKHVSPRHVFTCCEMYDASNARFFRLSSSSMAR